MKLLKKIFIALLLLGCASTQDPDDPLKNSKKLIKEGHKSLYNNGAFEVKGSSIKLIPPFAGHQDLTLRHSLTAIMR